MPAFNSRDTVAPAVHSALAQTCSDLEVIVVDDASTDDTVAVLAAIKDRRLRLVRHARNAGEGPSRNSAIEAARGEWIAVLDADDAWEITRLEKLLSVDRPAGGPVVLADNIMHCYTVDGALKPWRPQWSASEINFVHGAALLETKDYLRLDRRLIKPVIPRRILIENGIRYSNRVFGADVEYMIRVLKSGFRLLILEEPLYLYRRTTGSMTDNPERAAIKREVFLELLEQLDFSGVERQIVEEQIELLRKEERYTPFLFQLKRGHWLEAASMLMGDFWLAAEFLRRLPESLRYRLHLLLHRGQSR